MAWSFCWLHCQWFPLIGGLIWYLWPVCPPVPGPFQYGVSPLGVWRRMFLRAIQLCSYYICHVSFYALWLRSVCGASTAPTRPNTLATSCLGRDNFGLALCCEHGALRRKWIGRCWWAVAFVASVSCWVFADHGHLGCGCPTPSDGLFFVIYHFPRRCTVSKHRASYCSFWYRVEGHQRVWCPPFRYVQGLNFFFQLVFEATHSCESSTVNEM